MKLAQASMNAAMRILTGEVFAFSKRTATSSERSIYLDLISKEAVINATIDGMGDQFTEQMRCHTTPEEQTHLKNVLFLRLTARAVTKDTPLNYKGLWNMFASTRTSHTIFDVYKLTEEPVLPVFIRKYVPEGDMKVWHTGPNKEKMEALIPFAETTKTYLGRVEEKLREISASQPSVVTTRANSASVVPPTSYMGYPLSELERKIRAGERIMMAIAHMKSASWSHASSTHTVNGAVVSHVTSSTQSATEQASFIDITNQVERFLKELGLL